MSSWGNLDNVQITGTVVVATANGSAVLGLGTSFTGEVDAGDYITIASNKYQVYKVNSDTSLELTSAAATTSAGVTAFVQQGPKYVANLTATGNAYTIQNIYGVSANEAGVPENNARNIKQTGWYNYTTYTDAHAQTRHKAEVLVAASKNFNENAAGVLQVDANDDTIAADYLLYFTVQPEDASETAGNAVTFVSAAASDPTGATITYQWYENNTTHQYTLSNAGVYSGTDSNTLSISDVDGLDGFSYYVVISGDGGADANTSDSATVTVE